MGCAVHFRLSWGILRVQEAFDKAELIHETSEDISRVMGCEKCKYNYRKGESMLYMVVEYFKNQDPVPVYRRFTEHGRLAPKGLNYVSSWVDVNLQQCFQLMETDHRELIDEWISNWRDIVDFDIFPVISSQEAADKIAPQL